MGQKMKLDDMEFEPPHSDGSIEEALDRLGTLIAPVGTDENDFVSRVMRQIGDVPAPRRPHRRRLLALITIIAAACVIAALVVWRTTAAHRKSPDIELSKMHEQIAMPASSPADAAAAVRTSTWSTVSESVVIENDVPVRKLLYREFERVELVDADGKTEGQMVVPTKAMLVASKERY
jgi:hypothetical protein